MDNVQRAFYELMFENEFIKRNGDAFQEFFSSVMEMKYPGDFIKTRPWGRQGDRKNDGYVKSTRTMFQVYAPNELAATETINKIDEDFNGCLPHWQAHFSIWTFVHNAKNGLGPAVTKKLLDLGTTHAQLTIGTYSYSEMRIDLFSLSPDKIAAILGPAPSGADISNVGFDKIELILREIAKKAPAQDVNIKPVSQNKLRHNQLSDSVETLLRAGMRKSEVVSQFFAKWHDATLGDQVATSFNEEYRRLKASGISPDGIFAELQSFAGGRRRGGTDHEASVLAVLAHLFEECDIFEDPEGAT